MNDILVIQNYKQQTLAIKIMQSSKRQSSKQCPVCYQQCQTIKKICENSHKLCEKCLFNLRKRQCPFCKNMFRIKKLGKRNTLGKQQYKIIFNEEDRQHDNIAVQEDAQEEHQMLRNYYSRLGGRIPISQLIYLSVDDLNSQMPIRYYRFEENNGEEDLRNMREHLLLQQNQQVDYITQSQHQIRMRDPQYRQNYNDLMRFLRRNRDNQLYNQQTQHNQQQIYSPTELSVEQQQLNEGIQSKAQDQSCNIFGKIGQLFISFGQKLAGKKSIKHQSQAQTGRQQYNDPLNSHSLRNNLEEQVNYQGFINYDNHTNACRQHHQNCQHLHQNCSHPQNCLYHGHNQHQMAQHFPYSQNNYNYSNFNNYLPYNQNQIQPNYNLMHHQFQHQPQHQFVPFPQIQHQPQHQFASFPQIQNHPQSQLFPFHQIQHQQQAQHSQRY